MEFFVKRKLLNKLAKFNNRRTFLLKCKHHNILPKFLTFNLHANSSYYNITKINRTYNNFLRKLLILEIDNTINCIKQIHRDINICKSNITMNE